jgi:hypothetical protein
MIGQEDGRFVGRRIAVSDSPQLPRIIHCSVEVVQHHGLIADQSRAAFDWPGYNAPDIRVALCSSNEVTAALMQRVESLEIQVPPVRHIEGPGFGDQDVEYLDVEPFAVGNMNKTRDLAAKKLCIMFLMNVCRARHFSAAFCGALAKLQINSASI